MRYEASTEPDFINPISWPKDSHPKNPDKTFEGYCHYSTYEEMLKDKERIRAFQNAILRNKYLFKDKIVLDIGCGTGILSFFAARAGARKVYAVDNSPIISTSQQIALTNSFPSILFIYGKIEEISLPTQTVDIIISDWMGYFLLSENLLSSLFYARDKYLVPGGQIFPDRAKLFLAGIEDAKYKDEKFEFWSDVYGIDMSVLRKISLQSCQMEEINSDAILSTSSPILELDLMRAVQSDLEFVSTFDLQFTRNDFMHGVVAWYEVSFSVCHKVVSFCTSPRSKMTYWKQSVFYLDSSQPVSVGQILRGSVAVRKSVVETKGLDIKMSFNMDKTQYPLHAIQYYSLSR